ncbi:MAG TPA: dephospho-CoA kinase [Lachnospiraceae bacterium]|nr:dephospho-CoA kinase [Lachnospiraceae bacterium]
MKVIGVTGGIGAGKSEVLKIIEKNCCCHILIADRAAHDVMLSDGSCYHDLIRLLGKEILDARLEIDRRKMAEKIFAEGAWELLKKVNRIVHPAVKKYIVQQIEEKRMKGTVDFFFIEAALLIEDGYAEICDELWYVRAAKEIRIKRLMEMRGYSFEKTKQIMDSQLPEEVFLQHCKVVIDNNGDLKAVSRQVLELLHRS